MKTSDKLDEFGKALAAAQGQMKSIQRNSTVNIPTKKGGSFSFDYATLDNVIDSTREPLSKNGLSVIQAPSFTENGLSITTRILHSSGQWVECDLSIQPGDNEVKTLGAVMTYLRRYSYTAMVCVAPDEDKDAPDTTIKPKRAAVKPATQPKQSAQKSAVDAFFDTAMDKCGLNRDEVTAICKQLKISYDPAKAQSILDTLCKEVESPSTMGSLIVAANRKTNNYYGRSELLMDNQYHIKGSIEKLNPDIVWPKPGNPTEWKEHLQLAIEHAEGNQPTEKTPDDDLKEAFGPSQAQLEIEDEKPKPTDKHYQHEAA